MKTLKLVVLLTGLLAVTQDCARAQTTTPALSFSGGGTFAPLQGTFGWAFTLSAPVIVQDLGYFDFGGNGLASSHDVAIWANDGTLLVSSTVPSGTTGLLDDGFRYTAATPLLLPVGSYVIGGFDSGSSGDPLAVDTSSITTASGISYDGSRSISSSSLALASGDSFGHGSSYFGPNFLFTVPEPSTTALVLLGAVIACVIAHRRRRQYLTNAGNDT